MKKADFNAYSKLEAEFFASLKADKNGSS